jgi:hypothetical protein
MTAETREENAKKKILIIDNEPDPYSAKNGFKGEWI